MTRIAVLLSGGVDSSVALMRLLDEGHHDIVAFYLKIWLEDEMAFLGRCPWEDDLRFVRAVCDLAGVPLQIVSLQREYFDTVVAYAIAELRAGHTPSPDVLCNQRIKYGAFVDRIDSGFRSVASGHHARTRTTGAVVHLLKGVDPVKDQTYFLCQLDQRQLSRCLFPIGHMTKSAVRELARDLGLPTADRPDSQGICFLGRIPYDDFVRFHLGERTGEIRDRASGRTLGEHRGYWLYTIGQRRGLGLSGGPWYVVAKDVDANVVWVTHGRFLGDAGRRLIRLPRPHWISGPPTRADLTVRVRHGEALHRCMVSTEADGALGVRLETPDPGIAAGQFAALYDGEVCLGGGPIASADPLPSRP